MCAAIILYVKKNCFGESHLTDLFQNRICFSFPAINFAVFFCFGWVLDLPKHCICFANNELIMKRNWIHE
jgi:hypothetical protein